MSTVHTEGDGEPDDRKSFHACTPRPAATPHSHRARWRFHPDKDVLLIHLYLFSGVQCRRTRQGQWSSSRNYTQDLIPQKSEWEGFKCVTESVRVLFWWHHISQSSTLGSFYFEPALVYFRLICKQDTWWNFGGWGLDFLGQSKLRQKLTAPISQSVIHECVRFAKDDPQESVLYNIHSSAISNSFWMSEELENKKKNPV